MLGPGADANASRLFRRTAHANSEPLARGGRGYKEIAVPPPKNCARLAPHKLPLRLGLGVLSAIGINRERRPDQFLIPRRLDPLIIPVIIATAAVGAAGCRRVYICVDHTL